jgi:hypothetical protein
MAELENVQFDFENRVFAVEGAVFRKTNGTGDAALYVPMGDTVAAITVKQIKSGFDIAPDSEDEKLLGYVTKALEFVREIYPGDSIPSEVLTGKASWMVDERYVAAAKARVMMQLVAWITGEDFENVNLSDILARAENPETKKLVQEAFADIAEKLGLGKDRSEEVVQLVDRFAHELSYIEALRGQLGKTKEVMMKLKNLYKVHQGDSSLSESITRCNTLMEKPIRDIFEKFEFFDVTIGEILNTLRKYDAQIEFVRKTRDELRQVYILWEEIFELWDRCDVADEAEAVHAIRETYQFAAQHFVQTDDWSVSR